MTDIARAVTKYFSVWVMSRNWLTRAEHEPRDKDIIAQILDMDWQLRISDSHPPAAAPIGTFWFL